MGEMGGVENIAILTCVMLFGIILYVTVKKA